LSSGHAAQADPQAATPNAVTSARTFLCMTIRPVRVVSRSRRLAAPPNILAGLVTDQLREWQPAQRLSLCRLASLFGCMTKACLVESSSSFKFSPPGGPSLLIDRSL
jgi:hypothetical protein